MVKVSLKDLREASGSLNKILGAEIEFRLSYRLRRIADKVLSEMKQFEKFRLEMVEKYGEKDKVTGQIEVKPNSPKMGLFKTELEKVLDDEVELNVQLIPIDLIEKSNIKLSAIDCALIEKFISTEKVEKEEKPKTTPRLH